MLAWPLLTCSSAALETVYYLSLYPPNRSAMVKNVYLMPKLKALMSNGKTADIKRKAIATFTSLKKATSGVPAEQPAATASEHSNATADAASAAAPLSSAANGKFEAPKGMSSYGFGDASAKKNAAVSISLFMKELQCEANKQAFERAMVNYKGVVSFWVELKHSKAVVRTTLSEEQLVKAILAQLGWIASGDAAYVMPGNSGYLDDEIGENGAIVQRASKKRAAEKAPQGGWFSSVTSYLW